MDLFDAPKAKRAASGPAVLTVTALTALIKRTLEREYPSVWVVGQVSNLSYAASGHVYFTLKDAAAEINAVIWRGAAERIPFKLKDGLEVVVHGRIAVYEQRGRYQIIVSDLQPKGVGALQLAFLQLKEKLEKEGLFDPARKKPIPFLPSTIAIVTSPTGAAIHDILTMIERRFSRVHVVIYPVPVQGEGAAPQIAAAIRDLNRMGGIDVMIVGRGGGSLEDLWPFNEEVVARAIYDSHIPVISAVGHEVDISISDLVADVRALTPTQAGELVVPSREELDDRLALAGRRMVQALRSAVERARRRLETIERSYALRAPVERVRQRQQRLDELRERVRLAGANRLLRLAERAAAAGTRLEALNPRRVLARGYSITTVAGSDRPLLAPAQAPRGTRLRSILRDGGLESVAD